MIFLEKRSLKGDGVVIPGSDAQLQKPELPPQRPRGLLGARSQA